MKQNGSYLRRELQRIIRNGVYVELEVICNSFCYVLIKNDKLDIEESWTEYGEIKYLDIQVLKHFKKFFDNKWLIISDFHVYPKGLEEGDKEVVQQLTLKDIYEYLNIKDYEFIEGMPVIRELEDYNDMLLSMPLDNFKIEVNKMHKADRIQLWNIANILWKNGVFGNVNKAKYLEEVFNRVDHFMIG